MQVHLPIVPIPQLRMRARNAGKHARVYSIQGKVCEEIRKLLKEAVGDRHPCACPLHVRFYFGIPMAKSWSKKKKNFLRGSPHEFTPDASNLQKMYEDCGNGILWTDDRLIAYPLVMKYWWDVGRVDITYRCLNPECQIHRLEDKHVFCLPSFILEPKEND